MALLNGQAFKTHYAGDNLQDHHRNNQCQQPVTPAFSPHRMVSNDDAADVELCGSGRRERNLPVIASNLIAMASNLLYQESHRSNPREVGKRTLEHPS